MEDEYEGEVVQAKQGSRVRLKWIRLKMDVELKLQRRDASARPACTAPWVEQHISELGGTSFQASIAPACVLR